MVCKAKLFIQSSLSKSNDGLQNIVFGEAKEMDMSSEDICTDFKTYIMCTQSCLPLTILPRS
jgi:hypothetical protein